MKKNKKEKWIVLALLIVMAFVACYLGWEVRQVEAQGVAVIAEKDEAIEYLRAKVNRLEAREQGWATFCKNVQFKLGVLDKEPDKKPVVTGQGG